MIKLHQFAPAFDLPNGSSFWIKLETCLRMAELAIADAWLFAK